MVLIAAVALVATAFGWSPAASSAPADLDVIITAADGRVVTAASAVESAGGAVERELELIGGVAARVPQAGLAVLQARSGEISIVPDTPVQLTASGWTDATGIDPNPQTYEGSVNRIASGVLQAGTYWNAGYTGAGVDVALIDSGVVPVNGLTWPGKVINGPDLSFESQSEEFRYLDTYGHGTHMASIIAGRDEGADPGDNAFLGVAPGARIVSIKVADHRGATDVSQVIAAIDWVVQHRNDNGMNIRVLNLSFGTNSTQSYLLDPLAFAVEQAWKAGIVVVVAAGNDGNDVELRNPATDPYVIAVGASNTAATRPRITSVMDFSNCGTDERHVDMVVPGESIAGLVAPGSAAADDHPQSVVGGRYILGSGTSQAAALVSGAAALILDRSPEATPDQVKLLLMDNSSDRLKKIDPNCTGDGIPNLEWAYAEVNKYGLPEDIQDHPAATGLGSLEEASGSDHLENAGVVLQGEQDIFGNPWDGTSWSPAAAQGTSWSGGDWNGTSRSGTSWSGTSWSGTSWSGTSWSGTSWSGTSWSGTSWSGTSWSGLSWGRRANAL